MSQSNSVAQAGPAPAPDRRFSSDQSIRQWLDDFAAAVRDVDYDRGRAMFSPGAIGFGTITPIAQSLDDLVDRQWRNVWGVTRGFEFHHDTLHCGASGDLAWAAVRWSSQGRGKDGGWFQRTGRCTMVFERNGHSLRAIHSHLSMDPVKR